MDVKVILRIATSNFNSNSNENIFLNEGFFKFFCLHSNYTNWTISLNHNSFKLYQRIDHFVFKILKRLYLLWALKLWIRTKRNKFTLTDLSLFFNWLTKLSSWRDGLRGRGVGPWLNFCLHSVSPAWLQRKKAFFYIYI